jgi:hypothetical protein
MTWKTLGTALENALASALNGEEGAATPSVSRPKKARAEARASREEVVKPLADGQTTPAILPTSRRMTVATASPKAGKGSPTHAAVIRLIVDNGGGGPARAQGGVRPGRLRNAGGNARELRLV